MQILFLPVLVGFILICPASARELPILNATELANLPPDGGQKFNRLIFEKSPYLLQHARNPVNWYPWNAKTLEIAKKNNKPIFLSIGYSSCHWCHVMERESFNDKDVAKFLNQYFLPIKVDREERPDIDRIYMAATQLIKEGRGGWPNNLWLTPTGLPFYAGTYFKKDEFIETLTQLNQKWTKAQSEVQESSEYMKSLLEQMLSLETREAMDIDILFLDKMLSRLQNRLLDLESTRTQGPKFPPHQILHFLTNYTLEETAKSVPFNQLKPDLKKALDAAFELLKRMAYAGIYDHLGGGFHRYSTDSRWFLPHYEKMLYDNTQLAQVYAAAFTISKNKLFAKVAHEIFDFMERDMLVTSGLYASAIDAESENEEGLFYFWKDKELKSLLNDKQYKFFINRYGIKPEGNFIAENGAMNPGYNTLSKPLNEEWDTDTDLRKKLLLKRSKRKWPLIDKKSLCDWNALAIESLAKASIWLNDQELLSRAERIALKLLQLLWTDDGLYHHGHNDQRGQISGYLSDYAYFARALIYLNRASGNKDYLNYAVKLLNLAWKKFYDKDSKNLFSSSFKHQDLIFRAINLHDDVLPAPPAVFLEANFKSQDKALISKAFQIAPYYLGQLIDDPAGSVSYLAVLTEFHKYRALNTKINHPSDSNLDTPNNNQTPKVKPQKIVSITNHPLQIEASLSSDKIKVRIKIENGFHINSAEPYQDYLIPTKIELMNTEQISLNKINYPTGEDLQLDFSDEDISVYEGIIDLQFQFSLKEKSAKYVNLLLHTQACSDSECLPPQKHKIQLEI